MSHLGRAEEARLAALHRYCVLDTPAEESFDRITRLAADIFRAPIALVSLVDAERQWFKSRHGLAITGTPREIAFCAYTILGNAVLVVPDALADARFRSNPLVTGEPMIRFYAGAPLIAGDGLRLGTLCIIDTAPRDTFSEADGAILQRLAAVIVDALDLRLEVRRRAAAEAREAQAEQMLADAIESLSEAFILLDPERRFVMCNSRYRAFYPEIATQLQPGVTFDEVLAHCRWHGGLSLSADVGGWHEHLRPADDELAQERLPSGRWVRICDYRTKHGGFVGIRTDITDLKRQDQELLRREQQLSRAHEIARLGGWRLTLASGAFEWSDTVFAMVGAMRGAVTPTLSHLLERVHADDRSLITTALARIVETRKPEGIEFRIEGFDGIERTVWIEARAELNDAGAVESLFGACQDITERKRAEDLVAAERAVLRAVTENQALADVLAVICRAVEGLIPASRCSVLLLCGKQLAIGAAPSLPAEYNAAINGIFIGPSVGSCGTAAFAGQPVAVTDIASDPRWAAFKDLARAHGLRACWSTPIRDRHGTVLGTFAVYHGTTHVPHPWEEEIIGQLSRLTALAIERKRSDEALVAAKNDAEEANRAKSQFLAAMSHELRTPLNAVIGFSDLLANQTLGPVGNPRYLDYARDIHQSGRHLLDLINDVLDMAKIETGKLEFHEGPVDLGAVVSNAVRLARAAAPKQRRRFDVAITEDLRIWADERAIRQIMLNLVSNAIKFTHEDGTIQVHAGARPGGVEIVVQDDGIGIPADKLAIIGQPFVQVENVLTRKHQGTGIGLFITRSLIERHGGGMTVESAVDRGTKVTARLPCDRLIPSEAQHVG